MIDDIRNWFGDLASGKIKDAQLALTKEQVETLRIRFDQLLSEFDVLRNENASLTQKLAKAIIENNDLKEKIEALTPESDRLDKECEDILLLLFEADRKFSTDQIAHHFKMPSSVVKAHFDILAQNGYARAEPRIIMGHGPPPPLFFHITAGGRAYAMKHRQK